MLSRFVSSDRERERRRGTPEPGYTLSNKGELCAVWSHSTGKDKNFNQIEDSECAPLQYKRDA